MIDNLTLKAKLENQLEKSNLNDNEKEKLVAELNFFANFLIDIYLAKKSDD